MRVVYQVPIQFNARNLMKTKSKEVHSRNRQINNKNIKNYCSAILEYKILSVNRIVHNNYIQ